MTDQKSFRLQNQRIMLTYKTHVNKKSFTSWFEELIPDAYEIKFLRIAHEGKSEKEEDEGCVTDYEHSHVLVEFNKAFQTRNERFFDYEKIHPHIRCIKQKTHWENALCYIAKEDPDNKDLKKENRNIVLKALNQPTLKDALVNCAQKYSDVIGITKIFELKEPEMRRKTKKIEVLRDWQAALMTELKEDPDDRKVMWICDYKGGCGKSTMIRLLEEKYDKDVFSIGEIGRMADFNANIASALENGWNGRICIFDLARAHEDRSGIYNAMETVKNGRITLTKYKGGVKMIPQDTHVVVFANFEPQREKLSQDRWIVRYVEDGKMTEKRPHNIKEADKQELLRALKIEDD